MATESEILAELNKFSTPLNLASVSKRLRMLAWGTEGVGKTTLFGKLVKALDTGGRIVVMHTDPGWDVLLDELTVEQRGRVKLVDYDGLSHVKHVVRAIRNNVSGWEGVEFFNLDTVSGMAEEFVDNLVAYTEYEHRNFLVVKQPFEDFKIRSKIATPHWNDYQILRNTLRPIIKSMVGMDAHVFCTAHVNEEKNSKGEATGKLMPSMPEGCNKVVAREVGLVGHLTRDPQGNRTVSLSTGNKVRAKSRIRKLDGRTLSIDEFVNEIKIWSTN